MKIKDILDLSKNYDLIMYRCNSPFEDEQDMLIGYASYSAGNTELTSEDGDSYSLNDTICKFKYDEEEKMLVVWQNVTWSTSEV